MKQIHKSPLTEGFDSRLAGRSQDDCPYTEGSMERELWLTGWRLCYLPNGRREEGAMEKMEFIGKTDGRVGAA